MQNKHVYEYAVVRLVPKVEREEFINIGVILFCGKLKFIKARFTHDTRRISALFSGIDIEDVLSHIRAFEQIAHGEKDSGPIGKLDEASRFRWLTATRSTILQASKIHPGFCNEDPNLSLDRLFQQFVEA